MTQEALLDRSHIRDLLTTKTVEPLTNEDREVIAYYWKRFMKTYKFLDWKWCDFFWSNFDQEYDDGEDYNVKCNEFMTRVILDTINNCSGRIDTMVHIYDKIAFVFEQDCLTITEDFIRFVFSEIDKKAIEFENTIAEYNS